MSIDLDTPVETTWCPGCGNFSIMNAVKMSFEELVESGDVNLEDIVISSGIGCHAKMFDYLKVSGFYSIHGRVPPTLSGVKIANPELTCVGFAGDGDAYDEGVSHLIHAARRNIDITMIIHNNKVFALTTGQFTPTSPKGFKGKSTPKGSVEKPINPLHLMLASNASFVARGFSGDINHLRDLLKEAINHPGFAIVDILQPCVTFYNLWDYYREKTYNLNEKNHDTNDFQKAWEKAEENDEKIPTGIFYKEKRETFENQITEKETPVEREKEPEIKPIIKQLT